MTFKKNYTIVVTLGEAMYEPIIEWDENKNQKNIKKHKISFELAQYVFFDEYMLIIDNGSVDNEQRWNAIGEVKSGTGYTKVLLLVSHTHDDEDGQEYIRIISARKAEPHEVKCYEVKKSTKRG